MISRLRICFLSAVICAATYIVFTILSFVRYPLSYSPFHNWLSDLGNRVVNPQGAVFYNTGVILTALFLAIWFTAGLQQWKLKTNKPHRIFLIIAQITGLLSTV